MVIVGILAVVGACFLAFVAFVLRWVDCSNESYSECSTEGAAQFVVALGGVVVALGMLVESCRPAGRPWIWFGITIAVFATWLLLVWALNS